MRRRLSFVVALLMLAGASSALALAIRSSGAGAITTLSDQPRLTGYELGSDAAGAATVMWTTLRLVGAEHQTAAVIRVRQQDAHGRWHAAVRVGGVTQTNEAQLVVSASGAAAVVWYYVQGGARSRTVLMAVTRRSAVGSWTAPRRIWSAANADGLEMATSSDASGLTTVAWASYGGSAPAIWVANVDAARGTADRPERVAARGMGGADPALAENAAGAAVLSWQRPLAPSADAIGSPQPFAEMAAQRFSAAGRWSAARRLGRFSVLREPASSFIWTPVAPASVVTGDGTAAVGWRAGGGEGGVPLEVSTRRPGQVQWSVPHTLTRNLGGFGLATGAHDALIAVWSDDTADQDSLSDATSADATDWSAPAQLVRVPGGTFGPILAAGADGRVALAALTGNHSPIRYLTRDPGGHWSPPQRVGTGDDPEVALGSHGAVTLLWEDFDREGRYRLLTRTQQ